MRPINATEKYFVTSHATEMVQLGIKLVDTEYTQFVLKRFLKCILGLHTKIEGENFVYHDDTVPVHEIPKNISTPLDATEWLQKTHHPDFQKALASIAVGKDMVAVNISHVIADGGYLSVLLEQCTNPYFNEACPKLSTSTLDIFQNEIKAIKNPKQYFVPNERLTNIKHPRKLPPGTQFFLKYTGFTKPITEFQCYDKKRKRLVGLSEALWVATGLSANAFDHKTGPFGSFTCVNLRPFLKPGQENLSCCNTFISIPVVVPNVTGDMPLSELSARYRSDFNKKLKDGTLFARMVQGFGHPLDGHALFGISNLGKQKTPPQVSDFYMQQTMNPEGTIPFALTLSYGVKANGKDSVLVKLRHAPPSLTVKEANKITKAMEFYLTQIQPNMTVKEALHEIEQFQKKTD